MRVIKIMATVLFVAASILFGIAVYTVISANHRLEPTITVEEDFLEVSIEDGEEVLLQGITASDPEDGDLTDFIVVESLSDLREDDQRVITVAVVDSDHNVVRATRTIQYTDYQSPVLALTTALRVQVEGTLDMSNFLRAWDVIDGNITGQILEYSVQENPIDLTVAGFYPVQVSVTNSVSDTIELEATVEVYDPVIDALAPKMELSQYMHYLSYGADFEPLEFISFISIDGVAYDLTEDGIFENSKDRLDYETAIEKAEALEEEGAESEEEAIGAWAAIEEMEVRSFSLDEVTVVNPVNTKISGWYEISYEITDLSGSETTVYALVYVMEEN